LTQLYSVFHTNAVAQQAELERVWCIVIEPETKSIDQAKILAREVIPKVNITTASRDTILAALRYLIAEPGSALKGVDAVVAANRIAEANKKTWSSLSPITTLKCGITKGKKLDALAKLFFVSAPTPPPSPPEVIRIKCASRAEIFSRLSYLSTHKIGGFETVDPEITADVLFTASKGKWKSLNPISKLECGIDTAKLKTLKTVLSL
jgi:hypothetical protein